MKGVIKLLQFLNNYHIYMSFSGNILKIIPNCGYRRMRGHLTARGLLVQWNRIQDSMKRVCPEGILMQALQLTAVQRRFYHVKAPLSLWHIDGNHKLIRLGTACHPNTSKQLTLFFTKAIVDNCV